MIFFLYVARPTLLAACICIAEITSNTELILKNIKLIPEYRILVKSNNGLQKIICCIKIVSVEACYTIAILIDALGLLQEKT